LNGFFFNLLSNYMSSKSGKIQVWLNFTW
jgi:hypothetical protein